MKRGPLRLSVLYLFRGWREHHGMRMASAMAFELFLAAIPMLALLGWILGAIVHDQPAAVDTVISVVDIAPERVRDMLLEQVGRYRDENAIAPVALLATVWLVSGAFHTLMTVFERALVARRRPWWQKRLLGVACAVGGVAMVVLAGWLTVELAGGPVAIARFVTGETNRDAIVTRWFGMLITLPVLLLGLVAAFFRIGVSRPGVKRRVWPGSLVTVALGGLATYAFTAYARTLARYTIFYGSLAAVAVFLIWLWLCCAALILGAELNAQLEGVERKTRPPPSWL